MPAKKLIFPVWLNFEASRITRCRAREDDFSRDLDSSRASSSPSSSTLKGGRGRRWEEGALRAVKKKFVAKIFGFLGAAERMSSSTSSSSSYFVDLRTSVKEGKGGREKASTHDANVVAMRKTRGFKIIFFEVAARREKDSSLKKEFFRFFLLFLFFFVFVDEK